MQITGSYWQMLCTDLIRGDPADALRLVASAWLGSQAEDLSRTTGATGREKPYRLPSRSGASFMERY